VKRTLIILVVDFVLAGCSVDHPTLPVIPGYHWVTSNYGDIHILYNEAGEESGSIKGQTLVCENEGATWLPFRFFTAAKSTEGSRGKAKSQEAIWTNEG
jgi:hypothetical protein